MKFGKSLSDQIEETIPEWRDKFLSYKELKKRLKLVKITRSEGDEEMIKRRRLVEMDFIRLLLGEIKKLNAFFVEKEEEYIIRLKEVQDRHSEASESKEERMRVQKEIVYLHGEMVLLENYSAINYTGLVKILKKYDKKTGTLIRLPFIQRVLQQPFFNTDLLYKLVKQCEMMLDCPIPANDPFSLPKGFGGKHQELKKPAATAEEVEVYQGWKELVQMGYKDSLCLKSAVSALRVLKQIRSGSSTVSAFSLPPLQLNVLEDCWKRYPVIEQVAK